MRPSWLSVLVLAINFICGCILFTLDFKYGVVAAIASMPVFLMYHNVRMSATRLWPSYLMISFTGVTSVLYFILAGCYPVYASNEDNIATLIAIVALVNGFVLGLILVLLYGKHKKFVESVRALNAACSQPAEVESVLLPSTATTQPYTVMPTSASENAAPNLVTNGGFTIPTLPYIDRPVVLDAPEVPEVYHDSPPPSYSTAVRGIRPI